MALAETQRIDREEEGPGGEVVLTILARDPWGDAEDASRLATEKLCTYLAYLHSDAYRARHGSRPGLIRMEVTFDPPLEVTRLLERTSRAAGIPIDIERPAPPFTPGSPSPTLTHKQVVQALFGLLGLLAGLGGAVWVWILSSSPSLAVYVFLMASYVIARGVADVITDPHKVRRALYFSLLPALSTGVLYLAWQRWDRMWVGVAAGLVGGMVVHALVAPLLFPAIHREEQQDSLERAREMSEKKGS